MDIRRSLDHISTDYSFFEKDQVLTHDQLNSIVSYLDDQTRLTRVNLLGVGIACGLRVSLQGSAVNVTKGIGVTTDGDILFLDDTVFDRYKLYDAANPRYAPFYVGDTMVTVYELIRKGQKDNRAVSLSQFTAQTGSSLNAMAAVLFMESYQTDRDICSVTDCDNLGQDHKNTTRLLMLDASSLGSLKGTVDSPHGAFSKLNEIVIDRPVLSPSDNTPKQLARVYRTACNTIHNKLSSELRNLYPACSLFLADAYASDPAPTWLTKLAQINAKFGSDDFGMQYYYDFLKDVAETCNHFLELLFSDTTVCRPDVGVFPKHLLLGNLAAGLTPDENRTGFYPSPCVSRTAEQINHAKFLARKLHTLIQTFQPPSSPGTAIRITPSLFEDHPLEERAIPCYYQVNTTNPIHASWNYRLNRQGRDAWNYSANAGEYGAKGGAANPLGTQTGRFSFFRIEGHLGQSVMTVLDSIETQIKSSNLPFTVRSVMLGTDRTRVVKRPGIRYTDLHRFHYVLRQDMVHQLDDVMQFSSKFKQQVDDAVTVQIVTNSPDDNDGAAVKDIAAEKNAAVASTAGTARSKLNKSYAQYRADTSWKSDVSSLMKTAGEFKYSLGKVVKTEFTTPFDSMISSTHIQWLDWLDDLIKARDEKQDDRLLFSNFITEHPGIEHFAGVVRGGTFLLVYDRDNTVVADFMLPYSCCETGEDEAEEPGLSKPGLRPGWVLENGIKVLPSREKFVKDKLINFKAVEFEPFINTKLDTFRAAHVDAVRNELNTKFDSQQKEYFSGLQQSLTMMGNALIGKYGAAAGSADIRPGAGYADKQLDGILTEARDKQKVVEYFRAKAAQADLSDDKRKLYEENAREVENELAGAITKAARYVSESGMQLTPGSEGMIAMMEMNKGLDAIKNPETVKAVNTTFGELNRVSGNAGFRVLIGTMIRK